jgi:uncharacterized protein YggE
MRNLILFTASFFCAFQLSADPELKGSPAELAALLAGLPKIVSVAGEAEVKVSADRASVTLKVTTESKSLQETLRLNQDVRAKMIALLKERGIDVEKVQSSKFSSTPKHWVFSDKAKSYRIENLVKVSVQDEKEFSAAAQLVDKFPEVQYVGVEFEHSDKEGLKKKALAQALDNASDRKRVFEERLGVKLSPKSFGQVGVTLQTPERRQNYELARKYDGSIGAQGGSASRVTREYGTSLPEAVAEESGSLFGELIFIARVSVDYAVETKP